MIQLTEEYVTKKAEEVARTMSGKDKMEKNQIRKFYDDFKILERRLNEKQDANEEWFKKELLPHIKFVKTKIAYNASRKANNKQLVTKEFKEYMDKQIDEIKTISDFKNFLMHYQAILAYFNYISEFGQQSHGNQPRR
jgi:CRISPR type III-A-associated protein Csm2